MSWHDLFGYFNFDDLYSSFARDAPQDFVFVEVGVFLGRSVAFMAHETIAHGKNGQIFAVDPWQVTDASERRFAGWGPPEIAELMARAGGAFAFTMQNMQRHAPIELERIRPLRLESARAARIFDDKSVDMVFIDADHSYEACRDDVNAWLPKVKPGGIIAGHDYDFPGVKQAVDECFGANNIEVSRTSWVHRCK